MATLQKNYENSGVNTGTDYLVIPYGGMGGRQPGYLDEIHELEISADSGYNARIYSPLLTYSVGTLVKYDGDIWRCNTEITEPEEWNIDKWTNLNWSACIDIIIKDNRSLDGNNNPKKYYLYNNIILKDGGRWHNEKAIALTPYQQLCYSVREISQGNANNVQVFTSCMEFLDPLITLYTITINQTPENADVLLQYYDTSTTSGYIIIPEGTSTNYTVSASHYITQTGSILADADKTIDVNLVKLKLFRLATNAPNATITLSATNSQGIPCTDGFIQEGNDIWVTPGTVVYYNVTAPHYVASSGSFTVQDDIVYTVPMSLVKHTLTIVPMPTDSTVTLTAEGFSQSGNQITVDWGTTVRCVVSYKPQYGSSDAYITSISNFKVENDRTEYINLDMKIGSTLLDTNDSSKQHKVFITKPARLEVWIVGGGAGGRNNLWVWTSGTWGWQNSGGGGGAYAHGYIDTGTGTYTAIVGAGGAGGRNNGGNTSVFGETAGGGQYGAQGFLYANGGIGGTCSVSRLQGQNGNNGQGRVTGFTGGNPDMPGGASLYGGHGAGGMSKNRAGTNGYVKVVYLGPAS